MGSAKSLAYDVESFAHDAFVVFIDTESREVVGEFHNDFTGIEKLVNDNLLVGYNNFAYDDYILTAMLKGWTPEQIKKLNDEVISDNQRVKDVDLRIKSIDCFQQIDVGKPSLKRIEANMGRSILESSVDFTIQRPLTQQEVEEVKAYNRYDVLMTIEVYHMRMKSYFEPKLQIIKRLPKDLQIRSPRYNTTTVTAMLLTNQKKSIRWSGVRLYPPKESHLEEGDFGSSPRFEGIPDGAIKMWQENIGKEKPKGYKHKEFGCKIDFSLGGIHGVNISKQRRFQSAIGLDFASLYPNIMVQLEALGIATPIFKEIMEERLAVKKSDPILSGALKLVINSTYGLLKNQYSMLYNPMAGTSVCIFGQILIYNLCKELAATGAKIFNINTDGVYFTSDNDDWKEVQRSFQEQYRIPLEEEHFQEVFQFDVNSYIAVKPDGSYKTKGALVGRYGEDTYFKNNSLRIVDIAITDYLIKGIPPRQTILKHMNEPRLFQIVLQAGGTYLGTYDDQGNKYQKVNRVFPKKGKGVKLYKKRPDGGLVNFPSVPDEMLIFNDDLESFTTFRQEVDFTYYLKLIESKLEGVE